MLLYFNINIWTSYITDRCYVTDLECSTFLTRNIITSKWNKYWANQVLCKLMLVEKLYHKQNKHICSKAAPVAEWLRWLISLSPLTIRSSHRCDWCGFEPHTGQKWDKSSSTCGCVRWFFPGYSRFRPTFWLARLDMSEIILKGTLNWTKKKQKKQTYVASTVRCGGACWSNRQWWLITQIEYIVQFYTKINIEDTWKSSKNMPLSIDILFDDSAVGAVFNDTVQNTSQSLLIPSLYLSLTRTVFELHERNFLLVYLLKLPFTKSNLL